MPVPNPVVERERCIKAGREWFVQLMLASLVLDDRPARMNTPFRPHELGLELLGRLDELAFGEPASGSPEFFWEYKLLARSGDTSNGWPDLAAVWADRVLLFELKTEPGSIREGQVDWYLELAQHHYSDRRIDLIYLTKDPVDAPTHLPAGVRYANLVWAEVIGHIEDAWQEAAEPSRRHVLAFADYLRQQLGTRTAPRSSDLSGEAAPEARVPGGRGQVHAQDLERARALVGEVMSSGTQAAYAGHWRSVEDAKEFGRALIASLEQDAPEHPDRLPVQVWVWRSSTGGNPLTEAGASAGFELRISARRK